MFRKQIALVVLSTLIATGGFAGKKQLPPPPAEKSPWQIYLEVQEKARQVNTIIDEVAFLDMLVEIQNQQQARDTFTQFFESSIIEFSRPAGDRYSEKLEYFKRLSIPAKLEPARVMVEQAALELLAAIVTAPTNYHQRQETFERLLIFLHIIGREGKIPFGTRHNDNQLFVTLLAQIHGFDGSDSYSYFGLRTSVLTSMILQDMATRLVDRDRLEVNCDFEQRAVIWLRKFNFGMTCLHRIPYWQNGQATMRPSISYFNTSDAEVKDRMSSSVDIFWTDEKGNPLRSETNLRKTLKEYTKTILKLK